MQTRLNVCHADTRHAELQAKWNRLDWVQMDRLREGGQTNGSDKPSQWARCSGEDYAMRNRYVNVDPYQSNRVKLEVPEGKFDYINASPIVLETTESKTQLKYIATQGPRGDSWSHIWRMIWKENQSPAVIVMLTQTHETGREKCYPYYPLSTTDPDMRVNDSDEFEDGFIHNLHLESIAQDHEARTEVREIDMTSSDGSESCKIWHLLFAGWPDFSVPEGTDRAAMLKLVALSRTKNEHQNTTNPRIVHCSAGIGRSGTFIALDWLQQELDEGSLDAVPDGQDPILKCVEALRDQRAGMVQSKIQFLFLYDVLRERWRDRWIAANPNEAKRVGIVSVAHTPEPEPALKRQKSIHEGEVLPRVESETEGEPAIEAAEQAGDEEAEVDDETRAELNAELMDADMAYESGKT